MALGIRNLQSAFHPWNMFVESHSTHEGRHTKKVALKELTGVDMGQRLFKNIL